MGSQIKFRNYTPQTGFLEGLYTVEKTEPQSITPLVEDKLKLGEIVDSEQNTDNKYAIDPEMLDPKKVDYDLKCRLEKKMEKLERKTTKCIDSYVKSLQKRTD